MLELSIRKAEGSDADLYRLCFADQAWRFMYGTFIHDGALEKYLEEFSRPVCFDVTKCICALDGDSFGFINIQAAGSGNVFLSGGVAPRLLRKNLGVYAYAFMIDHLFTSKALNKVSARIYPHNRVSLKMHKSLGFTQEGCLRQDTYDETSGQYRDTIYFGMLREQYLPLRRTVLWRSLLSRAKCEVLI